MLHSTISVSLGERSYAVHLGAGLVATLGATCTQYNFPRRVVVLADTNSARAALRPTLGSLKDAGFEVSTIVMPPGERQKSFARAAAVHGEMLRLQIPRQAGMIALGGGVVGDVAGFVASTFRRGLTFAQCPTTLLSQVDSSVGGKNGVNHPLSKNAVGTFHQPVFVCSDVELLSTLPRREVIAGLGEILKYPIVSDPPLLDFVETHLEDILLLEREAVLEVASRCLTIKTALVSEDERELLTNRGRVFLNVGHAVGHALETQSHYALRHGEAVLLGILAEGFIAVQSEGFPEAELHRFVTLYKRLKRRYDISGMTNAAIVKSVIGKGSSRFVLPSQLGSVRVVRDVSREKLIAGLMFLRRLID